MHKNFLSFNGNGCRIFTKCGTILIDPKSKILSSPDWIVFSGPDTAMEGFRFVNDEMTPVFSSIGTKKLMLLNYIKYYNNKTAIPVEDIIDLKLRTKNNLRKKGEIGAEIILHGYGNLPGSSAIHIKLKDMSLVYVSERLDLKKALPRNDVLVINITPKIPLKSIISCIPKFSVNVSDMATLFDVLDFFNSVNIKNLVGIDHSITEAACEFFKYDCAVFSNAVKPLTSLEKKPPIIITANPKKYKDRPSVSSSLFTPGISLSDIYYLGNKTDTNRIIAYSPLFKETRTRGNITFCGTGSEFEI